MDSWMKRLKSYQPQPLGVQRIYAILMPLVQIQDEWHLLFEIRSATISQPGETSFPGGRVDNDETPGQAAIRETCEELLIEPETIKILGELDSIIDFGRWIHCFVGVLTEFDIENFTANSEVERIFTVPIEFFKTHPPEIHALTRTYDVKRDRFPFDLIPEGQRYPFDALSDYPILFYSLPDERLWGITATFVNRLIQFIYTD